MNEVNTLVKSQSLQLRQELSLARHDWVCAFVNFSIYFLFVAIPRVEYVRSNLDPERDPTKKTAR
jgi:hypothetical protein